MKKILVVCSGYPSFHSPANHIFIEDQATVLARQFDVMVYVAEVLGRTDLFRFMFRRTFSDRRSGPRCYRRRIPVHPRLPGLLFSTIYYNSFVKGIEIIIKTWGKPDLIHSHFAYPAGWASARLSEQLRIPAILTEHCSPFSAMLSTAANRRCVRKALLCSQKVVAVSPALARQMTDFCPELKVDILGNVIRTDFFSCDNELRSDKSIRFITVGLLQKRKGVRFLLEAAAILVAQGRSNFELVIGGDGKELSALKETAYHLGLSPRCRFLGLLTRSQVRDALNSADVFILPSLGETFGIVLGEAMACGKPVISTRCGGPEFVITPETGLLVEPGDSKSLADAMDSFISGRMQFDHATIRRSICRRFGEEAFLASINDLYREASGKGLNSFASASVLVVK
jgi:glycosyltransferase involved in cell wall biosynthesis